VSAGCGSPGPAAVRRGTRACGAQRTVGLGAQGSSDMDLKRVKKEAAELSNDSDSAGVSAKPMDEDMKRWKGTISGPKDTPYDGGTFVIDIELTSSYPFEPPKMKFDTRVWHPNVSSQTGAICLDILKKEWSPALTIKTALISVQALLAAPEPDDPQDGVVAKEYLGDFEKWKKTARLWTEQYAMASADTQILAPLLEMGFSEEQVIACPARPLSCSLGSAPRSSVQLARKYEIEADCGTHSDAPTDWSWARRHGKHCAMQVVT